MAPGERQRMEIQMTRMMISMSVDSRMNDRHDGYVSFLAVRVTAQDPSVSCSCAALVKCKRFYGISWLSMIGCQIEYQGQFHSTPPLPTLIRFIPHPPTFIFYTSIFLLNTTTFHSQHHSQSHSHRNASRIHLDQGCSSSASYRTS